MKSPPVVKEPKMACQPFVTPAYASLPKYGKVFGKHYIPIKVNTPKLNVS